MCVLVEYREARDGFQPSLQNTADGNDNNDDNNNNDNVYDNNNANNKAFITIVVGFYY